MTGYSRIDLEGAMEAVGVMMKIANQHMSEEPQFPSREAMYPNGPGETDGRNIRDLRLRLLAEEYDEYLRAEQTNDLVGVADGLADMLVIIIGTAMTYGINIDHVFKLVMQNNFEKFPDGKASWNEHGKFLKPEGFKPLQLTLDDLRIRWGDDDGDDTITLEREIPTSTPPHAHDPSKAASLGTLADYISSQSAPQSPEQPAKSTDHEH